MRIALSSAAFYGWGETEDHAREAARFAVDCCEVFLQTPSEYAADFGRLLRESLGDVPCVAVHPKGTQFELDLFGRSPRQQQDAFRLFTGVCEAGQAVGARYYVFHGPPGIRTPIEPGRIHNLTHTMARMQRIAADHGMEVLWENVCWCALRRVEDVETVKALLPDVRFVLDVKQAVRSGVDPLRMAGAMGGRLAHVHALDHLPDGGLCLPGEGTADWQGLARLLRDMDYRGAVVLEPYAWQTRDEERLRRSLAFLREVFAPSQPAHVAF